MPMAHTPRVRCPASPGYAALISSHHQLSDIALIVAGIAVRHGQAREADAVDRGATVATSSASSATAGAQDAVGMRASSGAMSW